MDLPSPSFRRIVSGLKRPLSPESENVPSRKKTQAKTKSRKEKTHCDRVATSEGVDTECGEASATGHDPLAQVAPTAVSVGERGALEWTFVSNPRVQDEVSFREQEHARPISPNSTSIPRVWTNSSEGFLTVYPELAKTTVGFSWFQSETPVLLLGDSYVRGHWINSTTLSIDLFWHFSCYDFELESIVELDAGGAAAQLHSMVHSSENTLDREAETMAESSCGGDSRVAVPAPAFYAQACPSNPTLQCERYTHDSHARGPSPTYNASPDVSVSADCPLYPSYSFYPPEGSTPPQSWPVYNGSHANHTTAQANVQPRIPLHKPLEVETLLNSQLQFIPLLLWISRDSKLLPCNLPPEYVYSCMGLFFISDLRHTVIQYDVSSDTRVVQGLVCWSVTLQWAPGGEDALFVRDTVPLSDMTSDLAPLCTTKDMLHPWWFQPADTLSQTETPSPYRPRDLRMQIFSCIPLDFLAEFHSSDSFPRGWFCKSCGMINIQVYFRHQICQNSNCGSVHQKSVSQGKVDSLSSLRDPFQSSILVRPTNGIPSGIVGERTTWDNGMQSWSYRVKDGVTLCHVFTGNQEHLQEDATALLSRIQCEVPLRKEDRRSPYFIHSTRLSHPSDGSESKVQTGTPDCVRIAYYTLCDFVHQYGEMHKTRFGEVRMQAWVNTGSKKGSVFRARKFPVVVHCLGAEVVLKFTPKGGYKDVAESAASEKGKGRTQDENPTGLPPTEPSPGPSRPPEHTCESQALSIPGIEATASPSVVEDVDEPSTATDMVPQCHSFNTDDVAVTDLSTSHFDPEMEISHEVGQPKQGVREKSKVIKDKSKVSVPEISITLVHGDAVVLYGDDFECQIVRFGTSVLVMGFPEET